jgi:hypothetical protein
MQCVLQKLPGGQAVILCGKFRQRIPKCFCGAEVARLCDFPLGKGKTCDRPVCARHAKRVGPDHDLCPIHAKDWANRTGQGSLFGD